MGTRLSVEGLGDAEPASGFEPVPAGMYRLECVKQEVQTASTGSTMVVLELRTRDCEKEDENDKAIWHNLVMGKKSAPFIKAACVGFGVELDGDSFDADDFVGAFCSARLRVTEYEGKQRNEVAEFFPPVEAASAGAEEVR